METIRDMLASGKFANTNFGSLKKKVKTKADYMDGFIKKTKSSILKKMTTPSLGTTKNKVAKRMTRMAKIKAVKFKKIKRPF